MDIETKEKVVYLLIQRLKEIKQEEKTIEALIEMLEKEI